MGLSVRRALRSSCVWMMRRRGHSRVFNHKSTYCDRRGERRPQRPPLKVRDVHGPSRRRASGVHTCLRRRFAGHCQACEGGEVAGSRELPPSPCSPACTSPFSCITNITDSCKGVVLHSGRAAGIGFSLTLLSLSVGFGYGRGAGVQGRSLGVVSMYAIRFKHDRGTMSYLHTVRPDGDASASLPSAVRADRETSHRVDVQGTTTPVLSPCVVDGWVTVMSV